MPRENQPSASQPSHRLRSAREFRGLTQAQLAQAAGVAPSLVCRVEKETGLPSSLTLVRVADALEVSTDYLLGRADNPAVSDVTARLETDIGNLSIANRQIVRRLVASLLDAEASRRPRVQGGDHDSA